MAKFLGFNENDAAKIMGLAAYGDAKRFESAFEEILSIDDGAPFRVNNRLMKFRVENYQGLEALFQLPKIDTASDLTPQHADVAAALQEATDRTMGSLSKHLRAITDETKLCLAGGVALNCVANAYLMRQNEFERLFVQPAAHDAGTALGAAYYIAHQMLGTGNQFEMTDCFLGPQYDDRSVLNALRAQDVSFQRMEHIDRHVASLIADGKIVGWFQGRLEFGPRALGNRSVLADPRRADIKDLLNVCVKNRETFRPFGASILAEHVPEWFHEFETDSISAEFMLIAYNVKAAVASRIPAVVHVDQTCRIQIVSRAGNPCFYRLLKEFHNITGVPLVLNTSFNDSEPIVCSPEDAIRTLKSTRLDFLAAGNYLAWSD